MTREDVRTDAYAELETNSVFFSETELNRAIQDGYDEVALFAKTIESRGSISLVANTGYYDLDDLLSNYYAVGAVFNDQTKRWLTPFTREELDGIRSDWELATGTPQRFNIVSEKYLCIFPRPAVSTDTLSIFYASKAPTITDSDTLILPLQTKNILRDYTIQCGLEQAREFKKAIEYGTSYERLLKKTAEYMSRRASPDKVYSLWQSGPIR